MRHTILVLIDGFLKALGLVVLFHCHHASAATFREQHQEVIIALEDASKIVGVPFVLLAGICWEETHFKTVGQTHLDGHSISYGLCQVKLNTAKGMDRLYHNKTLATAQNLEYPWINAFYAAQYIKHQLFLYDNNWELAADAYNRGNAVDTKSIYVQHVTKNVQELKDKLQ